jgi:hypothetical protein
VAFERCWRESNARQQFLKRACTMRIEFGEDDKPEFTWDLTLGYRGQVYPVGNDINQDQLLRLLLIRHMAESEAIQSLPGLFAELTGIQDRMPPETLFRFFSELMLFIDECVSASKGSDDADCLDHPKLN